MHHLYHFGGHLNVRYRLHVCNVAVVSLLALLSGCASSKSFSDVQPVTATLTSISLAAPSGSLSIGATRQFTATGSYSDGTTKNLSSSVTWSSSNSAIADVNSSGLVTAISTGTATITATLSGISASSAIQIQPASLISITVLPAAPVMQLNTTQQLTASGQYSDGSQQDLSKQVQWSSSDTTKATIDPTGLATAVASGSTKISAVMSGITGATNLTVNTPQLASIVVDQDGDTVPLGLAQQLTATGVFTDNSTAELIGVTFTSSDLTIVSVDANGLATTNAVGSVTITATAGSVSGTGILTVGPQTLLSIAVAPTNPSIPLGLQQQFTVTGTFTDSSTQQLTSGVTWTSSDPTVASVDVNGLANSVALGSATITAQVGALSSSGSLTVTGAQLVSVAVLPGTETMPVGASQQFIATGTYNDTSTQDLTDTVSWISSKGSIATINNTGLATGVTPGTVTITASSGGFSGTASLIIDTATVSGLTISPLASTAVKGKKVQFSATAQYSDGSSRIVTNQVSWSASKPSIAHINGAGLARAHKIGTVTIKAKFGSTSASTSLTVVTGP
jgi:uncharacterized protein YjdB